jgi:hypothetical protein
MSEYIDHRRLKIQSFRTIVVLFAARNVCVYFASRLQRDLLVYLTLFLLQFRICEVPEDKLTRTRQLT